MYTIPAMNAAEWVTVLIAEEFFLWDIVPGLCPEAEEPVKRGLMTGDLTGAEYRNLCLDVLTLASGRQWWVTLRLIGVARSAWTTIGAELAHVREAPLGAWLDTVFSVCIDNMREGGTKPEQVQMFLSKLEAPPPGSGVEVPEMEMSRSAFLAMG